MLDYKVGILSFIPYASTGVFLDSSDMSNEDDGNQVTAINRANRKPLLGEDRNEEVDAHAPVET